MLALQKRELNYSSLFVPAVGYVLGWLKGVVMELLEQDGDSYKFKLADRRIVRLDVEYSEGVKIYAIDGKREEKIGELNFSATEEDYGAWAKSVYKLTHAFLEGKGGAYKRNGIATKAFELFCDCHAEAEINLPIDDGMRHADGSHVTSEGCAFIGSLRRKFGGCKGFVIS